MKLLIAVGGAAESVEAVPGSVQGLLEAASEILVIAPVLPGRLSWLASATDEAREQADERLARVLGQLEGTDTSVGGAVGADDPLLAFEDAVAQFGPDHILIAIRDSERAGWQERGLLDSLVARFSVPLSVFVVPG